MKLWLNLILCFSTLFRLFFNTTAPSRYRDRHIPSCCCHCHYSSFLLVEKLPRRHPQRGFPAPRRRVYQRRRPALCGALEAQHHASASSNHQTAGDDDPSPQHPFPAAAPRRRRSLHCRAAPGVRCCGWRATLSAKDRKILDCSGSHDNHGR